jgi:hypothetical protein
MQGYTASVEAGAWLEGVLHPHSSDLANVCLTWQIVSVVSENIASGSE